MPDADDPATGGPAELQDREIVAIIAYMQRLGRDIHAVPGVAAVPAPGGAQP